MSFDKKYPNRKDHRKQYYGSKACDRSCRPGGNCPYCKSGRLHKQKRQEPVIDDLATFEDGYDDARIGRYERNQGKDYENGFSAGLQSIMDEKDWIDQLEREEEFFRLFRSEG